MDGFATARKIRQELPPPLCNIPIIALTADSNPEQLRRCLNVGMNATLIKPFDRVELARKVMEHALRKT
jgi:CheY-like chemotaxis protein